MQDENPYQSPQEGPRKKIEDQPFKPPPQKFRPLWIVLRTCMFAAIFSAIFAFLGPACDYELVESAGTGLAIGVFLGLTTSRGGLILVGALAGGNMGAPYGDAAASLGLGAGAVAGFLVGWPFRRSLIAP